MICCQTERHYSSRHYLLRVFFLNHPRPPLRIEHINIKLLIESNPVLCIPVLCLLLRQTALVETGQKWQMLLQQTRQKSVVLYRKSIIPSSISNIPTLVQVKLDGCKIVRRVL
jgi:hypothetical protein